MHNRERLVLLAVLLLIAVTVAVDLATDSQDGASLPHLLTEGTAGLVALLAAAYLLKNSMFIRRELEKERAAASKLKGEAEEWRSRARGYVEGLSRSIDEQLSEWRLTPAEKEVAFLLLKGMSLKEIAEIRQTTEKTARVQSMAIYSKGGLSGRSELAAFFLEDLLLPWSATTIERATP